MKIYTKGGDRGETGLFGGGRVPKDHLRIRAYGSIDELNAILGVVLAEKPISKDLRRRLIRIQSELFQLGSELATPRGKKVSIQLIGGREVLNLEKEIDSMESTLKPLKSFILPGGCRVSALLHVARTIARRAERELMPLHRAEPVRQELLQYLNRLSDYLFVSARLENHTDKEAEILWKAPRLS